MRPGPHQRGLTIYQRYIQKTSQNLKKMESGLTTSPSTPCAPSWSIPKDKIPDHKSGASSMKSSVWNALRSETAHTLETKMKDHIKQKSPRTAVGDHEHPIKKDNVKVIAWEDNMWRRQIRESIEIRTRRPAINRDQRYEPPPPPPHVTNCCHVTAVPVVTWPRMINLIRLMKWPWWSRNLATL